MKETEYRLIKELFAFEGHRIGVCFQYEFKDKETGAQRATPGSLALVSGLKLPPLIELKDLLRCGHGPMMSGIWYRAYGNENWDFADNGQMKRRQAGQRRTGVF